MILKIKKSKDYELIDSGSGEKLERYGNFIISRPDPEALWNKKSKDIWKDIDLRFERNGNKSKWIIKNETPKDWIINYGGLNMSIKPTSFKHIGIFPEQLSNWEWMKEVISKNKEREISVLNLFAYTGGATLACASVGASVCHVDSSKMAVSWAKENSKLSNLEDKPIRWIIEDVLSFLKREIKRGRKYDAIIMDPPSFGHGPKDELWKIEENFFELMKLCEEILSDDPVFVLINGYTAGYSGITYENNLKDLMKKYKGKIESGELAVEESDSDRLLPCGIFARWSKA
jgi:23S rRNA (cytosine1962-C5)-methyltransferase